MAPTRQLTFLICPIEAVGHINACVGIGQQLLNRGHRVTFATPNSWKGKLKSLGFEEEYYQEEHLPPAKWGEIVAQLAPIFAMPSIKVMEYFYAAVYQEIFDTANVLDTRMRQVVATVKPDLILVDNVAQVPAWMDQGIPWIFSTSMFPLCMTVSEDLPPGGSGYAISEGNKEAWKEFEDKYKQVHGSIFADYKSWVQDKGGPELILTHSFCWLKFSPYANICMYPEEFDCKALRESLPNFHRFDSFVRKEDGKFELPEKLKGLVRKWIYFSMGTIGSSDLGLMRKLLGVLAKSPNKFIIAKGPVGDELELTENMWGETNVPQTLILPLMDLVISHGGNNTVTESFYFGKPLLVLPIFLDQLDNGTRLEEVGLGLTLQPYHVTETKLLQGIDQLLNDKLLKNRMREIGTRIRAKNSQKEAADLVESVALNPVRKLLETQ